MEVKIDTRESDFERHIGVNTQDGGVCISLGRDDGWHWISKECAEQLAATLLVTTPAGDVLNERHRQVAVDDFTPEHDDTLTAGTLAQAAACYAVNAAGWVPRGYGVSPYWPFDEERWKPKGTRQDLVRAAALIITEIERLDRKTQSDRGVGQ